MGPEEVSVYSRDFADRLKELVHQSQIRGLGKSVTIPEAELSRLRRDSEALGRVNQELEWMNVFGLCVKGNGDTTSIKVGEELLQWHGKLKSAIADTGTETHDERR